MRLASCLNPIKLSRLSGRDVILLFVSFLGCVPTCEQVCEKLTECESLDSVTTEKECQSACTAQELLYDDWEDEVKREAFETLKVCIGENECTDIADGVCYNETIYLF